MIYKIIGTTDGKFVGKTIDISVLPLVLGTNSIFYPDRAAQVIGLGQIRLANSNYSIDLQELYNG